MAKPNYAFDKRQREIAKKKKKEEKRQQKSELSEDKILDEQPTLADDDQALAKSET